MKDKSFILITGIAGFIGFNLGKSLLEDGKYIIGVDNINDYYSVKLKKDRVKELRNHKKFIFFKENLDNFSKLKKIFLKFKIEKIIHLAAQAGVRYSINNPRKYQESNLNGFFNILELSRLLKIKKVIYASSSSVYGNTKKFPVNENFKLNPNNFYGLTKKNNEETAEIYSKYYDIKLIGLRFFTVYGEWGRPDMSIFKIIDSSFKNKKFYLNNYGKHNRDFTYIKDVIKIIKRIKFKKPKHVLLNICSNKPISLFRLLKKIQIFIKLPKIIKRKMQKADVLKTHGDNRKVIQYTGFTKFTNLEEGLENTINWYKKYNSIKN